ncbi:DUF624 domain-containing protein [Alkalihalobacillus sp. NPDC078783]
MNIQKLGDSVMHYCDILMRLAVLNLLWLGFTLLGLGLFGWAPAAQALYRTIGQAYSAKGLTEVPLRVMYHQFKRSYKQEFIRANLMGWGIILTLLLLLVSGRAMILMEAALFPRMILLTILFLFLSVLFFSFPLNVYRKESFVQTVRSTLTIGIANVHYVVVLILVLGVSIILCVLFPGLILFYGISVPAAIIMKVAAHAFDRIGFTMSEEPL